MCAWLPTIWLRLQSHKEDAIIATLPDMAFAFHQSAPQDAGVANKHAGAENFNKNSLKAYVQYGASRL